MPSRQTVAFVGEIVFHLHGVNERQRQMTILFVVVVIIVAAGTRRRRLGRMAPLQILNFLVDSLRGLQWIIILS